MTVIIQDIVLIVGPSTEMMLLGKAALPAP